MIMPPFSRSAHLWNKLPISSGIPTFRRLSPECGNAPWVRDPIFPQKLNEDPLRSFVAIFDDCWVGDFTCVTGEGGDAYFVDLAGGSDSGVDYELLIGLSTLDDSVLGGDHDITPLPPDPRRFEDASFRWLLTDGVRTTEITWRRRFAPFRRRL